MSDAAAIAPMVEQRGRARPDRHPREQRRDHVGRGDVEHPLDAWQKVVALNLTAMFVASQEVGKRCMLPREGARSSTSPRSSGSSAAATRTARDDRLQHDARAAW
jgi:gluconate 5-dehydrogenase